MNRIMQYTTKCSVYLYAGVHFDLLGEIIVLALTKVQFSCHSINDACKTHSGLDKLTHFVKLR